MYGYHNDDKKSKVHSTDILAVVTQEQIIQFAINIWPEEGKMYQNPLRKDKNPGMYFYWGSGYLRMMDRADSRFRSLNCWDIVQRAYRLNSFREALDKVADHFGIRCSASPVANPATLEQYVKQSRTSKFTQQLDFRRGKFTKAHADFFIPLSIAKEHLRQDHVYACSSYRYNTKAFPNRLFIERPRDICFVMWFPKTRHKKIYRPTQKATGGKKWITDCYPEDIWWDSETYSDLLIINGGYVDGRLVKNEGHEVRGLQSETTFPSKEKIISWYKNSKHRFVFMDMDEAGIREAKLTAKKMNEIVGEEGFSPVWISGYPDYITDNRDLVLHRGLSVFQQELRNLF